MTRIVLWCSALTTVLALPALAQDARTAGASDDPAQPPVEQGLRFTPGIARAMARQFTGDVLARRYELDAGKVDQASELVARRLMQMVHDNEEYCQEAAESLLATALEAIAQPGGPGPDGVTREFGTELGKRALPALPAVHKLIDGVIEDVRPMLGFKGQIKMTADATVVNVALGCFEQRMQRWSKGGAKPFEDPFNIENDDGAEKDQNGQSKALNNARRSAESMSKRPPGAEWDKYVEEAGKYYDFDPSQVASAQSLLRDYRARALVVVGGAEAWRNKLYQTRLWLGMATHLPGRWDNPVCSLLLQDQTEIRKPVKALFDELCLKIDEIPTQAQRESAERRVMAALAAKGLDLDKEPAPGTSPASEETAVETTTRK